MTEHLSHVEVERLHAIALSKREMSVARGLADNIQRCTLALGDFLYALQMLLVDEQTHALLTLVGYYLLCRKGLVTNRQLRHVYLAAALLYEFRQTVQVSCRAVVVYRDNRIVVALDQSTHEIVCAFLHFRVRALHGVQLDTVAIASRINRRDTTATQSDAVVVATYDHNLIAFLRLFLQTVALGAVSHTAGEHYHLVVSILLVAFFVLKRKQRTADERLAELVSEVGSTVRRLYKYLLRSLIEPLAHGKNVLPVSGDRGEWRAESGERCAFIPSLYAALLSSLLSPLFFKSRIRCHIHSSSGYRP